MAGGNFGLSSLGYNLKRVPDFTADLQADIGAAFPGANVADQSVFGQLIGIFSAALAEREEQNFAIYNNSRITTAEGVALDNLGLLSGIARNAGETDASYRARLLAVSLINSTPQNSTSQLCQALQGIEGVEYLSVNVDTVAGGYEVVILGGDDAAIAETIFAYHPAGANIIGTTEYDIESGCGFCQRVAFTRPTPVDVCVRLVIDPLPEPCQCDVTSVSPFEQAVFDQLTASGTACNSALGVSIYSEQFYAALLAVGQVRIVTAEFSTDGGTTYAAGPLSLTSSQYAVYTRTCIDVTFL